MIKGGNIMLPKLVVFREESLENIHFSEEIGAKYQSDCTCDESELPSNLLNVAAEQNNTTPPQLTNDTKSYGALSPVKWMYHKEQAEKILQGTTEGIVPLTAYIVPTLRCNHRCYFCTYGGAKGFLKEGDTRPIAQVTPMTHKEKDMPYDLMIRIIDQLSDAGVKGIVFTGGGEPTIYTRFLDGMKYCRKRGLEISMNTNGSTGFRLAPDMAKELIELQLRYLRVSLNSGSGLMQKLITGTDDFEYVISNIKALGIEKMRQKGQTDISIGYVLNVVNVYDFMNLVRRIRALEKEIQEMFHTEEEVFYSIQIRPVSNYESSKHYIDKNIKAIQEYLQETGRQESAQEFIDFMFKEIQTSKGVLEKALDIIENEAIPFLEKEGSKVKIIYPKQKYIDLPTVQKKPYKKCLACPFFLFIWPNGNLYHCIEWSGTPGFEIGNIAQMDLMDILRSEHRKARLKYIDEYAISNRCAPICAHHEMNISLNNAYGKSPQNPKEAVDSIVSDAPKPRHINFL